MGFLSAFGGPSEGPPVPAAVGGSANPYPNCQAPVDVRVQTAEDRLRTVAMRCGGCWSCLGAKAHQRAGKLLAEIAAPWHEAHELPGEIQFATLTYNDEALPVTVPEAHPLGVAWNGKGPYCGPFAKPAKGRRPFVWEGVAYWWPRGNALPRALTLRELATEHERYLREGLGWNARDVTEWIEGRYEPLATVRRAHSIAMLKRLRRWLSEHYPDRPMFRFAFTGEYGDEKQRPHYHTILIGWPITDKAREYFYKAWRSHHANSFVHPYPHEAERGALTLAPGTAGAQYVCKDMAKMRRDLRASPALAARELPFQAVSEYPPLGKRSFESWVSDVVAPVAEQAEAEGLDDLGVCLAVRAAYQRMEIRYGGRPHMFATPRGWREAVRKCFDDAVWREATWTLRDELADAQGDGQPWREEVLHGHCELVAEKNRGNEARTARRKRAKALRRLATAQLGSDGSVLL